LNRKLILLIFSLALLLAAGLVPVYHLQKANQTLADQVASMQKELEELRQTPGPTLFEAESKALVMNYREIENKYIIIKEDAELLLLPVNSSPSINHIASNTIAGVNDAIMGSDQVWLNITIPVYDSPANMKGWVLESQTEPVTDANRKLIKNGVIVKAGSLVYETENYEDIANRTPTTLESEHIGHIRDVRQDFVRLDVSGGNMIWVRGSDITYPDLIH